MKGTWYDIQQVILYHCLGASLEGSGWTRLLYTMFQQLSRLDQDPGPSLLSFSTKRTNSLSTLGIDLTKIINVPARPQSCFDGRAGSVTISHQIIVLSLLSFGCQITQQSLRLHARLPPLLYRQLQHECVHSAGVRGRDIVPA